MAFWRRHSGDPGTGLRVRRHGRPLEDLMTCPAVTVHANATLAQAARTTAHAKVERLPVVDDVGMLQGIVSRADLLKVFLRDDEEIAEEVRREVVACLFRAPVTAARVDVRNGVVKLIGHARDASLVPVAAHLIRAVEGVVDAEFELTRSQSPAESTAASTNGGENLDPA
ncbi:CBS domain-containing protein [Streptomyces sp. NA02950]|nr:CBS domain-containing protein [Streptomyces sp. NA02950]